MTRIDAAAVWISTLTISTEARTAAMKRVLVLLAKKFWDEARGCFGDADIVDASPLQTTLAEMEDKRYVQMVSFLSDPRPYLLTPTGWFDAQRISGTFESEDFAQRRARLYAALKDSVKGRQQEAILDFRDVARAARVSDGWVCNVLESHTLLFLDSERNYMVQFDGRYVTVPRTFGQVHVML